MNLFTLPTNSSDILFDGLFFRAYQGMVDYFYFSIRSNFVAGDGERSTKRSFADTVVHQVVLKVLVF